MALVDAGGSIQLKQKIFAADTRPIEEGCDCRLDSLVLLHVKGLRVCVWMACLHAAWRSFFAPKSPTSVRARVCDTPPLSFAAHASRCHARTFTL